jgi:hypothetical protein
MNTLKFDQLMHHSGEQHAGRILVWRRLLLSADPLTPLQPPQCDRPMSSNGVSVSIARSVVFGMEASFCLEFCIKLDQMAPPSRLNQIGAAT